MAKEKKDSVEKKFDVDKLKHTWEDLQKMQKDLPRYGKGISISHVKIVDDGNGGKNVQINLSNGDKIRDAGDKHDLFIAMMPKKHINYGQLASLIAAVRYLGFSAVAMGLPPEVKRALLRACDRCGVPLKPEAQQKRKPVVLSNNTAASEKKRSPSLLKLISAPVKVKVPVSFSSMTSPRTLDCAVRFQQKRNKEYTSLRLARCENEAKDEFLTLCCQAASDLGQKDESKLTGEEKKIKAFLKRYVSKDVDVSEFLSENREKILKKMSLKDLPDKIRRRCSERQKRYKYICTVRNKALEMAQAELKKTYYQKDIPFNLSIAALVRLSAKKMPPPKERSVKNLVKSVSDMNVSLKTVRKELKDALKQRRKKIGGLIKGVFVSKDEKKASRSVVQSPCRHNFAENALVRNMLKDKSLSC